MVGRDHYWMQLALEQARKAESIGEIPVGAILVLDNDIISAGYNQAISQCDPTAHAEIDVLRQAGLALNNYRLLNTTLYVTLEPCVMCAGALIQARVKRLVFGALDVKAGAVESAFSILKSNLHNHQVICDGGVLAEQSREILQKFFKERRVLK